MTLTAGGTLALRLTASASPTGACAHVSYLGASRRAEARTPATELCATEAFRADSPEPAQSDARNPMRSDELSRRHRRQMRARRAVHAAHVVSAMRRIETIVAVKEVIGVD